MANVTNEINTIEELIEKFEGGYAVSVGEQGHIWVYDNALDAATDTYGHKAELVVTRCDDLYAEFEGGNWIGIEGPKAHELAEDLDDLLAIFIASAETGYVHISDRDMTSLPTFGGDDMDEEGVWSWDEGRCLIGTCANDMEIVARCSLAQIWEGARDNEHDAFDEEYVEEYAWNALNVHITTEQAERVVGAEERWSALCEAGRSSLQNEWDHLVDSLCDQVHG